MSKLGAAFILLVSSSAALAQPAEPAPAVAAQPVVVVSPGPVVVTQPAPVVAAPATVAVAPAGPGQTHDWNDLNHVNGQLVKVGETNDYLKSYKRTNISTNPIGWIIGSYSVSASYGINNHAAIRGDVGFLSNYLSEDVTGFSAEVGVPLYFRRTYQGPFLEPGFAVKVMELDNDIAYADCYDCSSGGDTETVAGPQMLFGWHWTWDSGFNLAAAFGIGRNWSSNDEYNQIFPNGYFRIGYAF